MPVAGRTEFRRSDFEFKADWIDVICDAFESAWQSENEPVLGNYLQDCGRDDQDDLFEELLLVDLECRRQLGKSWTCEQYLGAYPQHASAVQAVDFATDIDRAPGASHELNHQTRVAGEWVGQFELKEKLGEGAEGEVWRAQDSKLQRDVALKLPAQNRFHYEDLQRSMGEGRALGKLNHPNIVRVYDIGRSGDTTYIVSDLIEGKSLRDALAKDRLSRSASVKVVHDLSLALQHAHERGVIHRDLKPANVMLDGSGKALITDFGLAKSQSAADSSSQPKVVGTPAYMSPEQTGNLEECVVDARSDIYSLGAILYELLTGVRPHSELFPDLFRAIVQDPPTPLRKIDRTIPRELQAICLKCLHKSPEERYPSAEELAHDLLRYQRGEPVAAMPVSPLTKIRKWIVRKPAISAALALAAISFLAMFVAQQTAKKNRELLGLRPVLIESDPSGAAVTVVPLDPISGEPIPTDAIRLRRKTPARQDLAPGDYLVVAVLPEGQFQEVFRRVPAEGEHCGGPHHHQFWNETENGEIRLPAVSISLEDVTAEMVMIGASSPTELDHPTGFYIDRNETSRDDSAIRGAGVPVQRHGIRVTVENEMGVSYDEAVASAERMGKRLPSKQEMAQAIEETMNSVQNATNGLQVHNLLDGLAEWTSSSMATASTGQLKEYKEFDSLGEQYRVVVGGGECSEQDASCFAELLSEGPLYRGAKRQYPIKGLGFRCVKSAQPRFTAP